MKVKRIQSTFRLIDRKAKPLFEKKGKKPMINPLKDYLKIGEKQVSETVKNPDGSFWFLKRKPDGRVVKVTVGHGVVAEITFNGKIPQ